MIFQKLSYVHGYVVTVTTTPINEAAVFKPTFVGKTTPAPAVTLPPTTTSSSSPPTKSTGSISIGCCRYDLGLGKNQPVKCNNNKAAVVTDGSTIPISVFEATKYLVEHDAVKDYPSPTREEEIPTTKQQQTNNNKRADFPNFQLRRSEGDCLHMYELQDNAVVDDDEADDSAAASTFYNENDDDESIDGTQQQGEYNSIMMKQKMDLNTVWVEMLIRHEQNKKNAMNQGNDDNCNRDTH